MLKICIIYKYFENIKQAYFYWNNNIEEEKEGLSILWKIEKVWIIVPRGKYLSSPWGNYDHGFITPLAYYYLIFLQNRVSSNQKVCCQMIEILNLAILKYLWYKGISVFTILDSIWD